MAITWRFVATKSPRFRTCSNFEAIYWQFFEFESNKNLLWCSPEGSLSQTWRTLLVTRPQKKENAPKEARKLDGLHGLTQIFRCRRFFWHRQRITVPIPKHAAAIWVVSTSISMLHFYLQQCCTIGDMVLSCLVLTSHALRASRWKKVVESPQNRQEVATKSPLVYTGDLESQ